MRKLLIVSVVSATIALPVLSVWAGEDQSGTAGKRAEHMLKWMDHNRDGVIDRNEFRRSSSRFFDGLDRDNDGFVSLAESQEPARRRFDILDANNDGEVNREEFLSGKSHRGKHRRHRCEKGDMQVERAAKSEADKLKSAHDKQVWAEKRKERAEKYFAKLDADKNGVISLEEFLERSNDRFEARDQDGDGRLSLDEFAARKDQRFAKIDADGDGKITAEELRAAAPRHGHCKKDKHHS